MLQHLQRNPAWRSRGPKFYAKDGPPPDWAQAGQPVALLHGWTAMQCVDIFQAHGGEWWIQATYSEHDPNHPVNDHCRPINCFRPATPEDVCHIPNLLNETPEDKTENEDMKDDLYTWVDKTSGKDMFATKVGVHPKGGWVMAITGKDADTVVMDPKKMELVVPYSVAVKFVGSDSKTYHYWATEGTLKEGDLVIMDNGSMARVSEANSKSKRADKWLTGTKIEGSPLKAGTHGE